MLLPLRWLIDLLSWGIVFYFDGLVNLPMWELNVTTFWGYIIHICWVLILMHWQQGSDFESKGDQLSFSAEYKIRTQGLWNRIPSRLNAHWWIDWAIEDKSKNLNSIAHLYDQRAFSPFDPTADMASLRGPGDIFLLVLCYVYIQYEPYNFNVSRQILLPEHPWKMSTSLSSYLPIL